MTFPSLTIVADEHTADERAIYLLERGVVYPLLARTFVFHGTDDQTFFPTFEDARDAAYPGYRVV